MPVLPLHRDALLKEDLSRLWHLLRAAGLAHDPSSWINIRDLLARLAAEERLPEDPVLWRGLIGPLVCRSPEDQIRFAQLFRLWLSGEAPPEEQKEKGHGAKTPEHEWAQRKLANIESVDAPLQSSPIPESPPRPKLLWIALGLSVLIALAAWASQAYVHQKWPFVQTTAVISPEIEIFDPPPPPPPKSIPTEISDDRSWLDLEPELLPPRRPIEAPVLRPTKQAQQQMARWFVTGLPVLTMMLWLIWRYWRRWIALRRGPADKNNPLRNLRVRAPADDLFGEREVVKALRALHTPVFYPSRRLDESATVASSVRANGLFQPVFADRQEIPEIVVMAEFQHGQDHVAGLGDRVVALMRNAGLSVYRYDYRDDPRFAREAQGHYRMRRLSQIAARHTGARFILLGDPSILLNVWNGSLHAWAAQLLKWEQRGILNTRPGRGDWEQQLIDEGFRLAPLNGQGLKRLSGDLSADWTATGGEQQKANKLHPDCLDSLPEAFRDEDTLLRPIPPEPDERVQLIAHLRAYFEGTGLYLLGAMAVYPQLHWSLTRALDRSLFPESGAAEARERRLLRLAQLPWCRRAYMPDWLREDLIEALIPSQRQRICEVYMGLFREVSKGQGEIILPIAQLPKSRQWRQFLKDLITIGRRPGVYGDRIFANLMLGGGRKLDLKLPGDLSRRFPVLQRWGAVAFSVGAMLVALAGAGAFSWFWQSYGADAFAQRLMAQQREEHAAISLKISATTEAAFQAEDLSTVMEAHGFTSVERQEIGDASGNAWDYEYGSGVEPEIAAYIVGRLHYLSYQAPQLEVAVKKKPDPALPTHQVRVILRKGIDPSPDFILQDALSLELSDEDRTLFSSAENFAAKVPKPPLKKRFRDTLKDGSQGPEMVVIPAGLFLMGSPGR